MKNLNNRSPGPVKTLVRLAAGLIEEARGYRADQKDPAKARRETITAIAAVLAAILSLCSLIAFVMLTLKTDKTASAAVAVAANQLREMRGEQRPWVSADPKGFRVTQTFPEDGLYSEISFDYVMKNSGHSPAQVTAYAEAMVPCFDQKICEKKHEPSDRKICQSAEIPSPHGSVTVFPDDQVTLGTSVDVPLTNILSMPAAKNGQRTAIIQIHFCLAYRRSGESEMHHSPYILMVRHRFEGVWRGAMVYGAGVIAPEDLKLVLYPLRDAEAD